METVHRYILEPYKGMNSRYHCPSCQHRGKSFSLYIDTETTQYVNSKVGRCNRESNCGYHYTPKQFFQESNTSFNITQSTGYKRRGITRHAKGFSNINTKPISFIPLGIFKGSLKAYQANHFVKFLIDLFGVEVASKAVSDYFIGTSKQWNGATVFWQIDTQGKVRTGKVMLYNPNTGKRVKEPFSHIHWVHMLIKQSEFELRQCFFGEHLLIDKVKTIAVVESEKTAVIASVYLPQFIWLAVGSLTNLNAEKCSKLKGRNVVLFPDLNGFEKWKEKAKEFSSIAKFTVSDLLERKASEMQKKLGLDIADYLLQLPANSFR